MLHMPLQCTRVSIGCLLAISPFSAAHAQTAAGGDTALPAVTVRAERDASLPLRADLASQRRRLDQAPGGTNLVQPQEEGRLATLRDALDHQPGLVIQDFFGGTDQPRLNIRGSGIQSNPVNRGVLLLQDGLPLNEADGSFIIGLIDVRDAALISARRGANARHPAATTLGGEVDFLSLTGADERGRVRAEAGSFGRQGLQVAAGAVGERLDGRFSASADRYDGYRHHSSSRRDSLRASLGFKGEGSFENRSDLAWTDLRFQIPAVVPKARVESDPRGVMGDGSTPQDTLLNVYKRDPRREATQWRLANRSRWGNEAQRHDLGLYLQHTDDLFNNQTSHTVTDSRTLGAQWSLEGRPDGGVEVLHFRASLATARSDMDRDLYATSPQTGQAMQRFGSFDLRAQSHHAHLGGDWRIAGEWLLVGDLQWSSVARDARNVTTDTALNQRWRFADPKLGLIWTPAGNASRWYTNLSRSHEPPTYWEIVSSTVAPNNPAAATAELVRLKVQRGTTLEVGGQGRIGGADSAPMWTVSAYHSEVEDELISTTDANGIKVGTYNYVGGTRHQGVEAGVNGAWPLGSVAGSAGAIDYRAAWTYSRFKFKAGEYAGKVIAGVPRHLISGEVLYRVGAWRVGPNLRWLPVDTPSDHANTPGTQQDAYALLGLKIDWRSGPWSAWLQGDNLSDRRYASSYAIRNKATADQPGYLPGLGRNVSAGVSYRF